MTSRRTRALALLTVVLAVALGVAFPGSAAAHGAPTAPLSRAAECGGEGTMTGTPACRAALVASPDLPTEWDNLRVAGVDGRDREVIPDGRLCSGGKLAFAGLDLPRDDWPTTELTAGTDYGFTYRGTIPHEGTFKLYVTKPGFAPDQPLTWAALETEPFAEVTDPPIADGSYAFDATLPAGLTGRHLIYTIWQNSGSEDTYYSCSDVVFTAGPQAPAAAPATPGTAAAPPVSGAEASTAARGPGGVPMPAVLAGSGVAAGGVALAAVVLVLRRRRLRAARAAGRHRRG
ncbi:lytic polysaccharide monooxygenase auxiliary activity family 9 protein [Pseudonocardia humida]|uniref:Lytic polysaccharide monooxygenase n=1 Tax=Pseudonocardia humida TaxID=2800819 RepID=A0ABT1A1R6_9PSEU|nr:lytic polysaccharide monooxygenase [Pseudonocardia humida]MCO1656951.1 lytic polysaccharide monooxygenase [Pseudonocardia humida]